MDISARVDGFFPPEDSPAVRSTTVLLEAAFLTGSSTKLFQVWQPGHCPIHLDDS
ncbi:hypothetical protein K070079E91_13580 [Eisenbergiella porci]